MALVKTRFAPGPTGLTHLGNVRTALFNVLLAKKSTAIFLLRIEDADVECRRDEHLHVLSEDLRGLGLGRQADESMGGAAALFGWMGLARVRHHLAQPVLSSETMNEEVSEYADLQLTSA